MKIKPKPISPHVDLLLIRLKFSENVGSAYRLALQFNIRTIFSYECAKPGYTNTVKAERHIPITKVDDLMFLKEYPHEKILLEMGGEVLRSVCRPGGPAYKPYLIAVANEGHGATEEECSFFDSIYTLDAPYLLSYNVTHALAIGLYKLHFG